MQCHLYASPFFSIFNCHGFLVGDQILEWNGIVLSGKSYEDVQQIISQAPNGEVELVIKPYVWF